MTHKSQEKKSFHLIDLILPKRNLQLLKGSCSASPHLSFLKAGSFLKNTEAVMPLEIFF